MCKYFSCIVTRKGDILWYEGDSHEQIIERKGLSDAKLKDRDFVRIEVEDGLMSNWKVDEEETLPPWYLLSEQHFKDRVAKILEKLNPLHVEYLKNMVEELRIGEEIFDEKTKQGWNVGTIVVKLNEDWKTFNEKYLKDIEKIKEELGEK